MLPKQGYSSADMPSKCYEYKCCNPCCQRDDRWVNPNTTSDWRAAGKRCGSDDKLCRDWYCGDCGRDGYTGPAVKHAQPPDENWMANALPPSHRSLQPAASRVLDGSVPRGCLPPATFGRGPFARLETIQKAKDLVTVEI